MVTVPVTSDMIFPPRRCGADGRDASGARPFISPALDVVERVLDERPVVGFGGHGGLFQGSPVHRAVPALAPLPGLPDFRWRFGRPLPARLAPPPRGLLPRPSLDRSGGTGLQLRDLPAPAPRQPSARSPG